MPLKGQRFIIDGAMVTSMESFYDELARKLPLPAHFGRNLDALWDTLCADIAGPLEIVWQRADLSRKSMGADFSSIESLFEELCAERADFSFQLTTDNLPH
jgi:ribonuclease inhibitor